MARLEPTVVRDSDGKWTWSWDAGTSPYSIYLDGRVLTDDLTEETYTLESGTYIDAPPPIEIREDGDTADSSSFPPYIILQWRGLVSAIGYIVEKFVDSNTGWINKANVSETGKGYYRWESEEISDDTIHEYRVTAISSALVGGSPISFSFTMIRNPAPPSVSMSVNSSGDIEVAAA